MTDVRDAPAGWRIVRLLADQPSLRNRLTRLPARGRPTAVVLGLDGGEPDPHRAWVVEGTVALVQALAQAARDASAEPDSQRQPVVLVLVQPSDVAGRRRGAAEATFEALRGLAQSATLEGSMARLRINVVAGAPEQEDDVVRAAGFLGSDASGFVMGATFDLRARS